MLKYGGNRSNVAKTKRIIVLYFVSRKGQGRPFLPKLCYVYYCYYQNEPTFSPELPLRHVSLSILICIYCFSRISVAALKLWCCTTTVWNTWRSRPSSPSPPSGPSSFTPTPGCATAGSRTSGIGFFTKSFTCDRPLVTNPPGKTWIQRILIYSYLNVSLPNLM